MAGYKVARLSIEKSMWDHKKEIDVEEKGDVRLKGEMLAFKNRVIAHRAELMLASPENAECQTNQATLLQEHYLYL